ncbi:MAG TPA: hypothetical protein VGD81_19060 [Opitutaceae bacterium]
MLAAMLLFALTTLEKLEAVPMQFWINAAIVLIAGGLAILFVRYASRMNKLVIALVVFLFLTVVCFQWVYERNEPKILTRYVDKIAPYFPARVEYKDYEATRPLPKS